MAQPTVLSRERAARQLAELNANAAVGFLPYQPLKELGACPRCLQVFHSSSNPAMAKCDAHGPTQPAIPCLSLIDLRIRLEKAAGGAK